MKINISNISINVENFSSTPSPKNCLFLLHGFSGSSKDWTEIIPFIPKRFKIFAIDLLGHGKSDSPADVSCYTSESIIHQLMKVILNFTTERVTLLGYSMGGRAALSFAAHYPNMMKGLILESVNPGLTDENLRLERSEQDDKLAEFIGSHSIESFVDYWMNISLFETQKNLSREKLDTVRNLKLENSRIGLANSLRGFGLGKMPPLNGLIINLQAPALLITGELDQKYTGISSGIADLSPGIKHVVIKNAGHNTHLEQHSLFIDVINNFLGQF